MSRDGFDLPEANRLPIGEYAFPGPLRDRLVAAILDGTKTSTSCLLEEYRREGEPLPRPGDREAVIDSVGVRVCVTEVREVAVRRLAEVGDAHALDEGEGYADAADWRRGHESFWRSPAYLEAVGEPAIVIDDDTQVVCVAFQVIARL